MTHDPERLSDLVSRRKFLVASGAAGATALAGCSGDGGDGGDGNSGGDGSSGGGSDGGSSDGGSDGGSGSEALSGDIRISGSSTVYPVAQEVTRSFKQQNQGVSFNLTRDGSGGGFENVFIPGDSDMNESATFDAETVGSLDAYRARLGVLSDRCDEAAAARQAAIRDQRRELKLPDEVPDVPTYLYRQFEADYPILSLIATLGDRLQGIRGRLGTALVASA